LLPVCAYEYFEMREEGVEASTFSLSPSLSQVGEEEEDKNARNSTRAALTRGAQEASTWSQPATSSSAEKRRFMSVVPSILVGRAN